MKLFEVYVNNGMNYADESHFTSIVVAENEESAITKVKAEKSFRWYNTKNTIIKVSELNIVDGYKVKLEKVDQKEIDTRPLPIPPPIRFY